MDSHPDPNAESDSEPPGTLVLVYFFLPLPEFLALPHGWAAGFVPASPETPGRVNEDEGEMAAGNEGVLIGPSAKFHSVPGRMHIERIEYALDTAAKAFGWGAEAGSTPQWRGESLPQSVPHTVAEVMVPIRDASQESIAKAFDVAISRVEQIQTAYYASSQMAAGVLAASRLPAAIPYALRRVLPGETTPSWPGREDLRLFVNLRSDSLDQAPPTLTAERLKLMGEVHAAGARAPFKPLLEVRRELAVARRGGSSVPTALLCGVAAEVLMREQVLMLMWEEGREPRSAFEAVGRISISRLVTSQFHQRLGGNWQLTGGGAVSEWASKIAWLRNRVVHIGYVPSPKEVAAALGAYEALERFFGDRLADHVRTYPLTADLFCGTHGLERRGALKAYKERLEGDVHPVDVSLTFSRWRGELLRWASGGPWVGDAARGIPTIVVYANGVERWWLADVETGLACLSAVPDLSNSQQTSLERMRSDLAAAQLSNHVSGRFEAHANPLEVPATWLPITEVLPLNEDGRFPRSQLPPPLGS